MMLQPPGGSRQRTVQPQRKKTNESPDDIVRKLQRLPANKKCCDCSSKLPSCVNLTIGSFVCITCGGIHRELNQRVKGVGHSSFTIEEADFLQSTDNEKINVIYLAGLSDRNDKLKQPLDNSDPHMLRNWIIRKYRDRAWYRESGGRGLSTQDHRSPPQPTVAQIPPKHAPSVDLFGDFGGRSNPAQQQSQQQWDAFGAQQQQANFADFGNQNQQHSSSQSQQDLFPADFGSSQVKQQLAHAPVQQANLAGFSQQQPVFQADFANFSSQQQQLAHFNQQQVQLTVPQQQGLANFKANFDKSQIPAQTQEGISNFNAKFDQHPSHQPILQVQSPEPNTNHLHDFANFPPSQSPSNPQPFPQFPQQGLRAPTLQKQSFSAPGQHQQPVPPQVHQQMPAPPQQQTLASSQKQVLAPPQQQIPAPQQHMTAMPQQQRQQPSTMLTSNENPAGVHYAGQQQYHQPLQPHNQQESEQEQKSRYDKLGNQQEGQQQSLPSQQQPHLSPPRLQTIQDAFAHLSAEPDTQAQQERGSGTDGPNTNTETLRKETNTAKYKAGQKVFYKSASYCGPAEIVKVHLDDALEPFYTINVLGKEKQTDDGHLAAESPLFSEIQKLLAILTDEQLNRVKHFILAQFQECTEASSTPSTNVDASIAHEQPTHDSRISSPSGAPPPVNHQVLPSLEQPMTKQEGNGVPNLPQIQRQHQQQAAHQKRTSATDQLNQVIGASTPLQTQQLKISHPQLNQPNLSTSGPQTMSVLHPKPVENGANFSVVSGHPGQIHVANNRDAGGFLGIPSPPSISKEAFHHNQIGLVSNPPFSKQHMNMQQPQMQQQQHTPAPASGPPFAHYKMQQQQGLTEQSTAVQTRAPQYSAPLPPGNPFDAY